MIFLKGVWSVNLQVYQCVGVELGSNPNPMGVQLDAPTRKLLDEKLLCCRVLPPDRKNRCQEVTPDTTTKDNIRRERSVNL